MLELRLGAIDLAPRDTAYVRALVRLFAHTEKLSWIFADKAPYHAVVANAGAQSVNPGFFATFEGLVLTLAAVSGAAAPPGATAADSLAYPIRADQFRDWLKLRQDSPRAPARPAAAPAPGAIRFDRQYKLRRWPPAALLREPDAMRMATFLSRNALDIAQLAMLTGRSEDGCRDFIGVLHAANLLIEAAVPAPHTISTMTPASGAGEGAQSPVAAPARRGLMASLRRHLGL